MGQSQYPDAWVSLQDYIYSKLDGSNADQPSSRISEESSAAATQEWTGAHEYMVKGIRPPRKAIPEEAFVVTLREAPAKKIPPPEADITIFDAVKQIYSVYGGNNRILARLKAMEAEDRRELASGRITQEEWQRRAVASAIIWESHGRRMEKISDWYLDNHFRMFENPPVEIPPDKKKH